MTMKLTKNMKLNDLLGVESTDTDGTDVRPLIPNLYFGQSQRRIALANNLGDIDARTLSFFKYWGQNDYNEILNSTSYRSQLRLLSSSVT